VPENEGQQHLYSPPLGHPRDLPLGHLPRPRPPSGTHRALRRATPALCWAPSPSNGHPSTLRWTPVRVSICPAHPLGITGHPRFSVELFRWATPSSPPSHNLYKYPYLTLLCLYYFFLEIHMAKNTKYSTMAFTHK
jgi:hypothetical protein